MTDDVASLDLPPALPERGVIVLEACPKTFTTLVPSEHRSAFLQNLEKIYAARSKPFSIETLHDTPDHPLKVNDDLGRRIRVKTATGVVCIDVHTSPIYDYGIRCRELERQVIALLTNYGNPENSGIVVSTIIALGDMSGLFTLVREGTPTASPETVKLARYLLNAANTKDSELRAPRHNSPKPPYSP